MRTLTVRQSTSPGIWRLREWLPTLLLGLLVGLALAAGRAAFRDARVEGTVRDELTGEPVVQGQVSVAGESVRVEDGTYSLRLPPGEWPLRASAPGFEGKEVVLDTRPAYPRHITLDFDLSPLELELRVQDAETGAPVPGARAMAGDQSCVTDAEGRCRWPRLHGAVAMRVGAGGYHPWQGSLTPEETSRHQEQHTPLLSRLSPVCLSVQVLDGAGQPVPGARVTTGSRELGTDDAGRVRFCQISGAVDVRVEAEGFIPWQGESQAAPGRDHPPLPVTLEPSRVLGVVRAADTGEPIPDAQVAVGSGEEARTGPDGGFVLDGLRRGMEGLVQADGYVSLPWRYAGQDRLELRLEPVRTLVEVQDALSGRPLPGARVGVGTQWAETDGTGRVSLVRVSLGGDVRVERAGYLAGRLAYTEGTTVTVPLVPAILEGTVRDASSGEPVPGAWFYTPMGLVQADGQGRYRLEGYDSPPALMVKAAGYRKLDLVVDLATLARDSQRSKEDLVRMGGLAVHLTKDGGKADLDLLLAPHAIRALYIPLGRLTDAAATQALLDLAVQSDLNGVVIDVKGDKGRLAFPPRNRVAQEAGAFRKDLMDLNEALAFCQEHDLYTVARMVVFKDPVLANAHPEWDLRREDGSLWHDRSGATWVNPYLQEVWDYNLSLAREVADLGFDEVQLDYLRFPSDGAVGEIDYGQESTRETRTEAMRDFAAAFAAAMRDKGVFTAADVFGLTVTVLPESDMGIGQRVIDIAPFVDYLCPMVYPSTFSPGNLGIEDPYASPYQVVYRSVQTAVERVPATTRVRPWLQYYYYGRDELLQERQAAVDAGAWGWMFWNAGAKYAFPEVFSRQPAE